jgi:hypothetical protein
MATITRDILESSSLSAAIDRYLTHIFESDFGVPVASRTKSTGRGRRLRPGPVRLTIGSLFLRWAEAKRQSESAGEPP